MLSSPMYAQFKMTQYVSVAFDAKMWDDNNNYNLFKVSYNYDNYTNFNVALEVLKLRNNISIIWIQWWLYAITYSLNGHNVTLWFSVSELKPWMLDTHS